MSHWNHRVIKKTWNKGYEHEESQYGIHEVFYNDDGEIYAHPETAVTLSNETIEDLREYLQWCLESLDKPILIEGEIVFAKDNFGDGEGEK